MYCFADISGYQKIGSYQGTGAAGNNVVTDFEPAFLMVKAAIRPSGGGSWYIFDNKRTTSNPQGQYLQANESAQELDGTSVFDIDFQSNGFTVNGTNNEINQSGSTYIYLAIAADPDTTTPTVENSFDVVTYTGNGGTQSIETDFKPDLVWIKKRSSSSNSDHVLQDSVRGISGSGGAYILYPNLANAQDSTDTNFFTSFDSNGFSLGGSTYYNGSEETYVAWCWKAGDHDDSLPQINTEGDIDSVVSVNAEAGFSIVKYTGNEQASQEIGHGLSSSPQIAFIKQLDGGRDWAVPLFTQTSGDYMYLNSSQAESTDTNLWSAVSSTTFTVGADPYTNGTGSPYIAYCFHSVTGYQKIGSYEGSGTTSKVVSIGFTPRFLIIKNADDTGDWAIFDSQRSPSNPVNDRLMANLSSSESTNSTTRVIDFDATSFELKTSNQDINALDDTYIYLAIK
jgi:hypothetical protein